MTEAKNYCEPCGTPRGEKCWGHCVNSRAWSKEELATLDYSYQQGWVHQWPGWAAMARLVNAVHGNERTASECEAEYTRYCDELRSSQNVKNQAREPSGLNATEAL